MQHCSFCVLWRALFGVGNVHNLWTMCHAWRAKCKQRGKRNTVKFVPPGHTFTDSASQTVSLKDTQCVNVHHTNKFCPISTLYLSCVWGWFDRKLETFKLRKGFFLTTSIFIIVSDTQAKIFNFSTIMLTITLARLRYCDGMKGRHCELSRYWLERVGRKRNTL